MKLDLSKLFAVEWSERQRAWHVSYLDDALRSAQDALRRPDPENYDYRIVAAGPTHEAAHALVEELKASLDRPYPSDLSNF